ncbi:hypothetical protein ACTJIJ_17395 [Niabella sp. 22666]|uniref:hypothetical protein n=1 Tax=Niabella sp. 22666 TaxID=3453954 RepID=UPI003F850043
MRKQLNYDEVLHTMRLSNSDELVQQGTLLLTLVHEVMEEKSLNKQDFIFTQYDEGHILITQVNSTDKTVD